jgi:hypothetical protein
MLKIGWGESVFETSLHALGVAVDKMFVSFTNLTDEINDEVMCKVRICFTSWFSLDFAPTITYKLIFVKLIDFMNIITSADTKQVPTHCYSALKCDIVCHIGST